jgi:hypothetical protein
MTGQQSPVQGSWPPTPEAERGKATVEEAMVRAQRPPALQALEREP